MNAIPIKKIKKITRDSEIQKTEALFNKYVSEINEAILSSAENGDYAAKILLPKMPLHLIERLLDEFSEYTPIYSIDKEFFIFSWR